MSALIRHSNLSKVCIEDISSGKQLAKKSTIILEDYDISDSDDLVKHFKSLRNNYNNMKFA